MNYIGVRVSCEILRFDEILLFTVVAIIIYIVIKNIKDVMLNKILSKKLVIMHYFVVDGQIKYRYIVIF
jgi:hypothetical protein